MASKGGSGRGSGNLALWGERLRGAQSCLAAALAWAKQERWAVERQLQRLVEVVGHPETGAAGSAALGRDWLPGGGTKFGHRAAMLGDLEHLTFGHDLCHDGTELGLGLKDSNSSHQI